MANLHYYRSMKEKMYSITNIRIIWFILYSILICLTFALIITLRSEFLSNPVVTTLETAYHPVNKIQFPGIAICNMNKISKKQAASRSIFRAANTNTSTEEILESIKIMGKLYDFDYDSDDDVHIARIQPMFEKLELNIIQVLKNLTPTCESLVTKCSWKGVKSNCSDIFQMRVTYDGFCCTFNYLEKNSDSYKNKEDTLSFEGEEGISRGLSIVVKNDVSDYLYTPLNSQGVTVLVFVPTDYPDKPSGSLSEVVAKINNEVFVEVIPTTVKTETAVRNYPPSKRQCLFDEERKTKLHGIYSQSDCNVDCRITSALALCECIPFMIPLSTKDTVCTLNHLACLHRYKNKWNSLHPTDDTSGMLQHEQHDSLRCSQQCYPSCDGTSYEIYSSSAPNHPTKQENDTNIRVYFGNRFSNFYKQDVVYYWFEMISNYGGTFGLIIGLSLASVIEFCIFCFQTLQSKIYL